MKSSIFKAARRVTSLFRYAFSLMLLALALSLCSPKAYAQSYAEQILYKFTGTGHNNDGGDPQSGLINVNGILYGSTFAGGPDNDGTLYSIDPTTHTVNILYTFSGNDGFRPYGDLLNVNGTLYGTTLLGGANNKGTVFSFDPSTKTLNTLYSFQGGTMAGNEPGGELLNVGGILYGTTFYGGGTGNGYGTIFSIKTNGSDYQTLYKFTDANGDGAYPGAGLINVNGTLYGTSGGGGSGSEGTVFSIHPDGSHETILYSFQTGANSGYDPRGTLLDVSGILYGTTIYGGGSAYSGTVFSFDLATNTENLVYSFQGGTDGGNPYSALIDVNDILYGTTSTTIFSINMATLTKKTLHTFTGQNGDGDIAITTLVNLNRTLYGTTQDGGKDETGTVFSLTPTVIAPVAADDTFIVKTSTARAVAAPGILFNDDNGGSTPLTATLVGNVTHGSLILHSDGSFTYTPNAGYTGTDSFTYRVANPKYQGNIATVTLNVENVNPPVAHNDGCSIPYNTARTCPAPGVLYNDNDGGAGPLTAALVTGTTHGSLSCHSDGSFTYKPGSGYIGMDTFTYQVTNALSQGNTATVTLSVVPRTPVAINDGCTILHNTERTNSAPGVLSNDDSGYNGLATVKLIKNTSHGSLTLHSDGSFTYTPNTGYSGTDTFTYQIANPSLIGNIATVTLTVQ